MIPTVVSYCYLSMEFAEYGSWDSHVQNVQLHQFVSAINISIVTKRL